MRRTIPRATDRRRPRDRRVRSARVCWGNSGRAAAARCRAGVPIPGSGLRTPARRRNALPPGRSVARARRAPAAAVCRLATAPSPVAPVCAPLPPRLDAIRPHDARAWLTASFVTTILEASRANRQPARGGWLKAPPFRYARPRTLDAALKLLAEGGGDARLLAGGQSLVPALNMRLLEPKLLIDINGVSELSGISENRNGIRVGALTRQAA